MKQYQWLIFGVCQLLVTNAVGGRIELDDGVNGSVTTLILTSDMIITSKNNTGATLKVIGTIVAKSSVNLTLNTKIILDLSNLQTVDNSNITLKVVSNKAPQSISEFLILPNDKTIKISNIQYSIDDRVTFQDLKLTNDKVIIVSQIPNSIPDSIPDPGPIPNLDPNPNTSLLLTVDATKIADALINGINNVKTNTASQNKQQSSTFNISSLQNWFNTNQNASTDLKIETMLHALSKDLPLIVEKNEFRIWLSPYYSSSTTKASHDGSASNSIIYGALSGGEYRSTLYEYTIGFVLGAHIGREVTKLTPEHITKYTGMNYGIYHSKGLWNGGRYDLFLSQTNNNLKKEVDGNPEVKNKLSANIVDFQMSHLIKWDEKIWSVRFNIGHTYVDYKTTAYRDISNNILVPTVKGASFEGYGGIGLRWNNKDENLRIRITGVYEFGRLYKSTGGGGIYTYTSSPTQSIALNGTQKKVNTHYLTLNISSFSSNSGWKFFAGYNGSLQTNTTNHTFTLKAEYRF